MIVRHIIRTNRVRRVGWGGGDGVTWGEIDVMLRVGGHISSTSGDRWCRLSIRATLWPDSRIAFGSRFSFLGRYKKGGSAWVDFSPKKSRNVQPKLLWSSHVVARGAQTQARAEVNNGRREAVPAQ